MEPDHERRHGLAVLYQPAGEARLVDQAARDLGAATGQTSHLQELGARMIRDTFRQSLSSRLFWVLLGISVICIAFCASVSVEGGKRLPTEPGEQKEELPPTDVEVFCE